MIRPHDRTWTGRDDALYAELRVAGIEDEEAKYLVELLTPPRLKILLAVFTRVRAS